MQALAYARAQRAGGVAALYLAVAIPAWRRIIRPAVAHKTSLTARVVITRGKGPAWAAWPGCGPARLPRRGAAAVPVFAAVAGIVGRPPHTGSDRWTTTQREVPSGTPRAWLGARRRAGTAGAIVRKM